MLIANPAGHYRFLRGISPYSCGVVADDGWEIVYCTLHEPVPWRKGFNLVDTHLHEAERDRAALCAMALRSPAPFTMEGFIDFNRRYCEVLAAWDLYVGDENPIARTNVAPKMTPPSEVMLHAFAYTRPTPPGREATVVVAGAGELEEGRLEPSAIVAPRRTDPEAMHAKADFVLDVMEQRLAGLETSWDAVTAIDVYTIHGIDQLMNELIWPRLGTARRHAVRLHHTRPPVIDIEFEMDVRCVRTELII